ncbi:MAG: plasmid mobilization relaxosome protein MobC [Pseudomonadota bacterium]
MTLRFSRNDYERLRELADGMALATYIRAIVLNEKMPRQSRRSASSVADKEVLSQILGLLGQSRIANNLNQLAYQANVGALVIDDETRAQIDEAYQNVGVIRETLITALGSG